MPSHVLLCVLACISMTSCTPVFERGAQIVPLISVNSEHPTDSARIRGRLKAVLYEVAEQHGMRPCPGWWGPGTAGPKSRVAAYYLPPEGVTMRLLIGAFQTDSKFWIGVSEGDPGSLLIADESDRFRLIWNDLFVRLNEEFPGWVSEPYESASPADSTFAPVQSLYLDLSC